MPNQPVDPVELTTAQVYREVNALRELIEARLDAMDRALTLLEHYPTAIDVAVGHLREVISEKFHGIQIQFESASQAVEKTEGSTLKQADAIRDVFYATTNAIKADIAALDRRMTTSEGKNQGISLSFGAIAGVIAVVGTIIAIIGGLWVLLAKGGT